MAHFFQVFRLLFFLSDTTVFFVFKGMGCCRSASQPQALFTILKKSSLFPPKRTGLGLITSSSILKSTYIRTHRGDRLYNKDMKPFI